MRNASGSGREAGAWGSGLRAGAARWHQESGSPTSPAFSEPRVPITRWLERWSWLWVGTTPRGPPGSGLTGGRGERRGLCHFDPCVSSSWKPAEHGLYPERIPTSSNPKQGLSCSAHGGPYRLPCWGLGMLRPRERHGGVGSPRESAGTGPPSACLLGCSRQRPSFEAPQTETPVSGPSPLGSTRHSSCPRLLPHKQGCPGPGLLSASLPEICSNKRCKQIEQLQTITLGFLCHMHKTGCGWAACCMPAKGHHRAARESPLRTWVWPCWLSPAFGAPRPLAPRPQTLARPLRLQTPQLPLGGEGSEASPRTRFLPSI